jgi:hypothetical protein
MWERSDPLAPATGCRPAASELLAQIAWSPYCTANPKSGGVAMVKSWRLALGVAPFLVPMLGGAIAGCGAPDRGDDPAAHGDDRTQQTRSALTTSLFQPFVAYATGSSPQAVAIGDLDGDGRNDIALLTSFQGDPANDKMVHVFLQAADGTLKPRVKYPVGGAGSSIDIGDVNGDGRADVVVGISDGSGVYEIGVLTQNASGTLDAMVAYPTVNAYQVKVGDFNGDGRMDVAGINFGARGDGLDVFLQTATGTLAAPVTYHVAHGGFDELDAGDVDGDGRTDLVVMSGQNFAFPNLSVLLQMPDGTFGAPASYSVGTGTNTSGVAIGDTNGDGRSDVVVSYGGNRPGSFIARFLQNAGGTLDPAVSYASYDIPGAIVLADVDGDGRKDALVTHGGFARLGVYRQFPSGDFLGEELYPMGSASEFQPQGLAVGDINGDGRPDAVLADANRGLVVLRHVQDTSLALVVTAPTGGPFYIGAPLTVAWSTGDAVALAGFDLSASFNGGTTYTPIAGCTGLPATAGTCAWTPAGPASSAVRVRVTARDGTGQTAFAESTFNLVAPLVAVTAPTSNQFVGVGGTTMISWTHNLPTSGTVRVELSRDNGATYETLADAAPISTGGVGTAGSFAWNVTGPTTSTARVRVTANGSLSASGNIGFAITTTPTLTVLSPGGGATWYTNVFSAVWTSNAGNIGTVRLELSRDGGATFETLVDSMPNQGRWSGPISGPSAANALVRVTMTTSFGTVSATGSSFTLVQPSLVVTSPAAGATLFPGTATTITWTTNLPASWSTQIELSRDGGGTYQNLAFGAPNSGNFAWTVTGPVTSAAQVRVTITGQGSTVATSGAFAIATPSLTVTSPAAGAALYAGSPLVITWATNLAATSPVTVELSPDGGGSFGVLAANAPNTGSFAWVVAGPSTGAALVRVTIGGPGSMSATSGLFAIAVPSLTVTSPGAGAALYTGTPLAITWSTNLPVTSAAIVELSRDGGSTFETLAAAAPNTGSFAWVVTGPDAAAASVRVTVTDPVAVSGASGPFAIATPSLTVTGPSAGALVYAGTPLTVTWADNLSGVDPVSIELSRDGGATFEVLAAAAADTGSFVWIASGPDTAQARVRVTSSGVVSVSNVGPAFQILTPLLTVTSPAAGASWAIGTSRTVSWSSNLPASTTVVVELSRDGGASWAALASGAPASGSLAWTATGPATSAAIVRVSADGSVPAVGTSGAFAIGNPAVAVTSPAPGASWTIGTARTITWTTNLLPTSTVKLELSRNGGSTYTTLASTAPNSGSFAWTPTGPASTNAKLRVSANGFSASGVSSTFSLVNGSVTVTSPNTAVTWTVGTVHAITWNHNLGAAAQFKIEVSRSGVWSVITSAVTGGGATSGSYPWTVAAPRTTSAKIRVTWTAGTTVTDTSDVYFRIN